MQAEGRGGGGNLSDEDIEEGYNYYDLWTTFTPGDIGVDTTWEPQEYDGGMYLLKEKSPLVELMPEVYEMAFSEPYADGQAQLLVVQED